MSFFNRIENALENWEERNEIRREERWLAEEEWEMENQFFDPYMHGEMFYDPFLNHHGVMYNGMWHPLDYVNGNWVFAHPSRFGVPRYYQPQNLQPPQVPGYGGYPQQGNYNQNQSQGPYSQPQGGYSQSQGAYGQQQNQGGYAPAPQATTITCPRCHSAQPAGSRFCASCGNDLSAVAAGNATTTCGNCGASMAAGARFCASCGHQRG